MIQVTEFFPGVLQARRTGWSSRTLWSSKTPWSSKAPFSSKIMWFSKAPWSSKTLRYTKTPWNIGDAGTLQTWCIRPHRFTASCWQRVQ